MPSGHVCSQCLPSDGFEGAEVDEDAEEVEAAEDDEERAALDVTLDFEAVDMEEDAEDAFTAEVDRADVDVEDEVCVLVACFSAASISAINRNCSSSDMFS
jgi:hypothetical protein